LKLRATMGRVPRTWPMHFEVDERTHRALHWARLFEDGYVLQRW
jgi:hypothetical protein